MTTLAPAAPHLDVRPLTGTIGAEIRGVDLREPLGDAIAAEIRRAWLRHKVLFFPDQHLEPVHQVAFARRFGALTRAHPVVPAALPDHPAVLVLDSQRARTEPAYAPTRKRTREAGWHTDVTFVPAPPAGSVLSARVVPVAGGDTLWSDGEAAYEALDRRVRRLVDGLRAAHDGRRTFGGFLEAGYGVEWEGERFSTLEPTEHPVVRTHPETGRRSLFVNPQFTSHIVGLSPRHSEALLDQLYRHMTVPEHTVRHRWRPGDIAFWDNRATMHYATLDYGDAPRVMHRVTLRGDRPA